MPVQPTVAPRAAPPQRTANCAKALELRASKLEINDLLAPVRLEQVVPPPPAPPPSATPTSPPPADASDDKLVLQVHQVNDLVNGDEAKMERLLTKARVMGSFPGGSIAPQGLAAIVVKAPHRVQSLVETMLGNERMPLRLKYFDVKDVIAAHPTLLDDLRPLLESVDGRTIDLKNGTLIVRASSEVLDSIGAKLEALRAAK